MRLTDISIKNLMRRKAKAGFIMAGLVVGVAAMVAVIGFVRTMTAEINHKMERYGANILILPKTEDLQLSYGGLNLGGVSVGVQPIRQADLNRLTTIKNAANIAATGPTLLGVVSANGLFQPQQDGHGQLDLHRARLGQPARLQHHARRLHDQVRRHEGRQAPPTPQHPCGRLFLHLRVLRGSVLLGQRHTP